MAGKNSLNLGVEGSIKTHINQDNNHPTVLVIFTRLLSILPMCRGSSVQISNASHAHVSDKNRSHMQYREKHVRT